MTILKLGEVMKEYKTKSLMMKQKLPHHEGFQKLMADASLAFRNPDPPSRKENNTPVANENVTAAPYSFTQDDFLENDELWVVAEALIKSRLEYISMQNMIDVNFTPPSFDLGISPLCKEDEGKPDNVCEKDELRKADETNKCNTVVGEDEMDKGETEDGEIDETENEEEGNNENQMISNIVDIISKSVETAINEKNNENVVPEEQTRNESGERLVKNVPEQMVDTGAEPIEKQTGNENKEQMVAKMAEPITKTLIEEKMGNENKENMVEKVPEKMVEKVPEKMVDKVPEKMVDKVPEQIVDKVAKKTRNENDKDGKSSKNETIRLKLPSQAMKSPYLVRIRDPMQPPVPTAIMLTKYLLTDIDDEL